MRLNHPENSLPSGEGQSGVFRAAVRSLVMRFVGK